MPDKVSPSEEAFARNVVEGLNRGDAAAKAGYSRLSATTKGSQLYRKPLVRRRVAELRAKIHEFLKTVS